MSFKAGPSRFTIRPFRADDSKALWVLFQRAIQECCNNEYTPEQIDAWRSNAPFDANWLDNMQRRNPWVVVVDDVIGAYGDLQSDGLIDHFFVSPDFKQQGLATALMQHLTERANALHINPVYADVSETAKGFFLSKGFVVVRKQQVTIQGTELTNYRMERRQSRHTSD